MKGKIYKKRYQNIKTGRIYPFSGMPIYYKDTNRWYIVDTDAADSNDAEATQVEGLDTGVSLGTYQEPDDNCFLLVGERNTEGKKMLIPESIRTAVIDKFEEYWDIKPPTMVIFTNLLHDYEVMYKIDASSWERYFPLPPGISLKDLRPGQPGQLIETSSDRCICGDPPKTTFIGIAAAGYSIEICQHCGKEK